MAKRRKTKKTQTDLQELITIAFAEDLEQAKDYETLLKNNDIPALIKHQDNPQGEGRKVIAVMVPEDFIDEAHVVIESQDAYDDFFDLNIDEEEDFGSDPFDDEAVTHAVALLDEVDARGYAEEIARRYSEETVTALEEATPQGDAGRALFELVDQLLHRDR